MPNILVPIIFKFIPVGSVACPRHFASADVYTLLQILREAPEHADLVLYYQNLAGFFTSIDLDCFVGSWFIFFVFI